MTAAHGEAYCAIFDAWWQTLPGDYTGRHDLAVCPWAWLAAAVWLAPGTVTGLRECRYCRSQWNVRSVMSVETDRADGSTFAWCECCGYVPM